MIIMLMMICKHVMVYEILDILNDLKELTSLVKLYVGPFRQAEHTIFLAFPVDERTVSLIHILHPLSASIIAQRAVEIKKAR